MWSGEAATPPEVHELRGMNCCGQRRKRRGCRPGKNGQRKAEDETGSCDGGRSQPHDFFLRSDGRAAGGKDFAELFYRSFRGLRHWLNPRKRCYYNLEFAFGEIPNRLVPYDYEVLASYPGKVVAVVTNVRTGEAEYKELPPYETAWETTIASCSIPVLFPPVCLDGEYYMKSWSAGFAGNIRRLWNG